MTTPRDPAPWKLLGALALLAPLAAGAQALPTAAQVIARIGVGWNIGNTLEVPGGETGWGNPAVTQRLIDGVKAAGFDAVRIPCAWDSHADATTHRIDPAWLARVKQVVDYCVGNGMYVVLNIHWDGGWLENHVLYSDQKAVNDKQKTYWTQIASYFNGYDERLLFAGTNEVHQDYGTPTAENIAVQQSYNQTFVDAVRATGGNNATRPLVVQTYNTNIGHGLGAFTPPRDSAADRLVVEVHYYDPYDYTGNENGGCLYWGAPYPAQSACSWAQESWLDDQFAKVKAKWVDRGFPVIVGEYGAMRRTSLGGQQLEDHLASRLYYLKHVNAAAAKNGIKTFYWDNGVQGNNGWALLDRNDGSVVDPGGVDAILQGAGAGPPTVRYALTTTTTGSGTVTRSPDGASYPGGTSVTLTARPAAGQVFAGWSGDVTGATNPVTITVRSNLSVVAGFVPQGGGTRYALAVTRAGTGRGTVTSSPAGVGCGPSCGATFDSGTTVSLTASADAGSSFTGWSGACTGAGVCTVSMTVARSVTATFDAGAAPAHALTVTKAGAGRGTVISTPSGIGCGASCSASFAGGMTVSLTATADGGSTFTGWSGDCTGTGACTVSLTAARSVTAAFDAANGQSSGGTAPRVTAATGCASGAGGAGGLALLGPSLVALLLRRARARRRARLA